MKRWVPPVALISIGTIFLIMATVKPFNTGIENWLKILMFVVAGIALSAPLILFVVMFVGSKRIDRHFDKKEALEEEVQAIAKVSKGTPISEYEQEQKTKARRARQKKKSNGKRGKR